MRLWGPCTTNTRRTCYNHLAQAYLFRLRTTPRFIWQGRTMGAYRRPPYPRAREQCSLDSQSAMGMTQKTKLVSASIVRVANRVPGYKKTKKNPWKKARFLPRVLFRFPRCAMRTAGQRIALAAQERIFTFLFLIAIRNVYGDKVAFSGSLLGCKRERSCYCNCMLFTALNETKTGFSGSSLTSQKRSILNS